jgi:hypothetical protein
MKIKSHIKTFLFGSTAAIALLATIAQAADPSGTWTWSTPGRNGAPDRVSTLTLKVEDTKLTGKVSVPGRDGNAVETPIADGKVDGDNISFDLVRQFNGNSSTNKYTGAVTADAITGKVESSRNGETQSRKWEAKRSTETK